MWEICSLMNALKPFIFISGEKMTTNECRFYPYEKGNFRQNIRFALSIEQKYNHYLMAIFR